ncbi:Brix-domain-containing protein [Coprinopsis marcescibilis]|uniref:Ribosome production factor 2 homolog n=1 Tax=Coprinopsis marcescibilis TaxID=230819 RepID=A0A5C3KZF0_COPMA|nr:Brix-domain-containing protein [Coprinopsis marcescibilis]
MLRVVKPRNARSKRALDAREPKEIEDPRTVIFVKGTHTGEVLNNVFKDLMSLKRPNAIAFNKKNQIHPFEDVPTAKASATANQYAVPNLVTASTSSSSSLANSFTGPTTPTTANPGTSLASLEFWAHKNDAQMFVVGQSTKKRPHNMTLVRMFDNRVLDMLELGVDKYVAMEEIKTQKCTPGTKPLLHFASELFDTHPRYMQLKSVLVDFFNGEVIDAIHLAGVEWAISVSLAPVPSSAGDPASSSFTVLPKIYLRTYTIKLMASGVRTPRVELVPMGPSLDLSLRRNTAPAQELWSLAMRRPKLAKTDVEKGLGKKRKNIETDDMGDLRGQIHIGKQDLGKLKGRNMKGLRDEDGRPSKRTRATAEEEKEENEDEED